MEENSFNRFSPFAMNGYYVYGVIPLDTVFRIVALEYPCLVTLCIYLSRSVLVDK